MFLLAALGAALLLPDAGVAGTRILGAPQASVQRAQAWARANGATPTFVRLARLYWRLAPPRGVRPEVAYAQSAKETAFGRFGGVLDASFHNPSGLKKTNGGGNYDPHAHRRFATWRQGVIAHLDHLALYAGARGYPKRATPDPRHFSFLRGRARTVQALGGAWAPSASYGEQVLSYARKLGLAPPPPPDPPVEPLAHFAEGIAI